MLHNIWRIKVVEIFVHYFKVINNTFKTILCIYLKYLIICLLAVLSQLQIMHMAQNICTKFSRYLCLWKCSFL